MDDGDMKLLMGLAVGAGLVVLVYLFMQQRASAQAPASDPALVQHNVIRDEEGRIRQVETFRGLNDVGVMAEAQPPTRPRGPALEEGVQVEWAE